MPTLDLITRFMGVDAGAAKGYASLGDSARLAAKGVSSYSAAEKQATSITKIAADESVRASDLRLQASVALRDAQRLEAAGDSEAADAAKVQADSLSLQAKAAAASARELNTAALAAKRQAASFDESKASTLTADSSFGQMLGHVTGLSSELEKIPAPLTIAAGAIGKLGVAAGITGLAVAGVSIDLATKYQSALTRLETGAGESAQGVTVVTAALLHQSRQLGVGATQLAGAMYPIESAGFHGAAGVKILHDAVEGALADGADYTTVADAVTSALNSYSLGAGSAAGVTDEMVKAVSVGKTTMQDLAGSIGTVIPEAAALHVPFKQVLGAISTMTSQGTAASKAATSLRYAIKSLADPTDAAIPILEQLGLKAGTLGDTMTKHGLVAAFTQLEDAVAQKFPRGSHAYLAALANVVGGTRGLTSVLELTGKHLKGFSDNTKTVAKGLNESKNGIQGWSDYTKTFKFNVDDAKAGLEELAISFGTKLLPDATKAMHWIATDGVSDLQQFGRWFDRNKGTIGNFAGFLVQSFGLMAGTILDFAGIVLGAMDHALGWVPGLKGPLKSAVKSFDTFKDQAEGIFTGLANSLYGIGNDTGASLADGIAAGLTGPAEAHALEDAHLLGKHAAAAVAKGARVQSPSLTTKYVGQMLAEGLIEGWDGEAGKIKDALSTGIQDALSHLESALSSNLTKIEDRFKTSEAALKSFLASRKSAISSLQSSIADNASISNIFGTDTNGNPTTANLGQYLGAQIGPLQTEARDLALLRKKGLSQALLSQISGLPIAQAVAVMQQILSGQDGSIASLNQQEGLIQRYAKASATTVVESPTEKRTLKLDEFAVAYQRTMVALLKRIDERDEREAARDVARHVTMTVSGHSFNMDNVHDLRQLISALRKLGFNAAVTT